MFWEGEIWGQGLRRMIGVLRRAVRQGLRERESGNITPFSEQLLLLSVAGGSLVSCSIFWEE